MVVCSSAQTVLPVSAATGKIAYHVSIPVDGSVSNEAAYELAQQWITGHPAQFTRANANSIQVNAENVNVKNQKEVQQVFVNATPLQSIDPSSNRLTAKVITKYTGATGGMIHLLYLEYFMVVTVDDHHINCEITDFSYNHFNERSYSLQRIMSWSNFSSLEPIDKLEYMAANEQSHEEFNKFYSFLNDDVNQLYTHLSDFVKTNKALTLNTKQ